jgi:hypothetical protein
VRQVLGRQSSIQVLSTMAMLASNCSAVLLAYNKQKAAGAPHGNTIDISPTSVIQPRRMRPRSCHQLLSATSSCPKIAATTTTHFPAMESIRTSQAPSSPRPDTRSQKRDHHRYESCSLACDCWSGCWPRVRGCL